MASRDTSAQSIAAGIAEWALAEARSALDPAIVGRIGTIVLDTLACACAARTDPTAAAVVDIARSGRGVCTLIGHPDATSPELATLANGVLVRVLDFNDIYAGPRQFGHPSDNIPVALAVAEHTGAAGLDLLQAIRLGYELYGRLQDLADPHGPWDHVSMSGPAAALMAGILLHLPAERLAQALALSAAHAATSAEVRRGRVSGAKSIANAVVAQTAVLLARLAERGLTGPARAFEGNAGFGLLLGDRDFDRLVAPVEGLGCLGRIALKPYPCFALAQAPIAAIIGLRDRLPAGTGDIAELTVRLADSAAARLRVGPGEVPRSREEADHSLHYLLAAALLDGHVDIGQFERARWRDPDVADLLGRIAVRIDATIPQAPDFPFAIDVRTTAGATSTLGSQGGSAGLDPAAAAAKFERCAAFLGAEVRTGIIDMVMHLDLLPSLRSLMPLLAYPNSSLPLEHDHGRQQADL